VVEGARLESVCTGNRTKGSNPFLSASLPSRREGCRNQLRRSPGNNYHREVSNVTHRPCACTAECPRGTRPAWTFSSERNPIRRYTGITSNVDLSLQAHNAGQNVDTAPDRPWILFASFHFRHERTARCFEKYLKSGSGRAFAKRHFDEVIPGHSDSHSGDVGNTVGRKGSSIGSIPVSRRHSWLRLSRFESAGVERRDQLAREVDRRCPRIAASMHLQGPPNFLDLTHEGTRLAIRGRAIGER
jgi:putative endonuclease